VIINQLPKCNWGLLNEEGFKESPVWLKTWAETRFCITIKILGLLILKEPIIQDIDLDKKLKEMSSGRTVSRLYELLTTATFESLCSIQLLTFSL
jgi:hypothetical protein